MKQMFDDYYKCFGCKDEKQIPDIGADDIGTGTKPDTDGSVAYSSQNARQCNECVVSNIGYAQAYVPIQTDTAMYDTEESLKNGTAYTALNMPYKRGTNLKFFGGEAMQ